jgi:hypothetical protein
MMNERIKELYEQAHERKPVMVVDPQTGNPIQAGWTNKPMYGNEFNPEKFAELIVRECAGIFEGVYTDQHRPERIDKRIKEHFGVE